MARLATGRAGLRAGQCRQSASSAAQKLAWSGSLVSAIRQAYLQEVEAPDVRLNEAHLAQSVLGEAFEYGTCVALGADGAYLAAGTQGGEVRL